MSGARGFNAMEYALDQLESSGECDREVSQQYWTLASELDNKDTTVERILPLLSDELIAHVTDNLGWSPKQGQLMRGIRIYLYKHNRITDKQRATADDIAKRRLAPFVKRWMSTYRALVVGRMYDERCMMEEEE